MSGSARAHDGAESWPKKRSRRKGSGKKTSVCEKQEKRGCPDEAESALSVLPDLTDRLIKCGIYEEYLQWREGYRRWREGNAEGAHGEGAQVASNAATTEGPLRLEKSWRDGYCSWRKGGIKGAQGKMEVTGEKMPEGYFWYVSPAAGQEHLRIQDQGWQHLDREGPYDGKAFIKLWQEQGSPMQVRALQDMLAKVMEASVERKLT